MTLHADSFDFLLEYMLNGSNDALNFINEIQNEIQSRFQYYESLKIAISQGVLPDLQNQELREVCSSNTNTDETAENEDSQSRQSRRGGRKASKIASFKIQKTTKIPLKLRRSKSHVGNIFDAEIQQEHEENHGISKELAKDKSQEREIIQMESNENKGIETIDTEEMRSTRTRVIKKCKRSEVPHLPDVTNNSVRQTRRMTGARATNRSVITTASEIMDVENCETMVLSHENKLTDSKEMPEVLRPISVNIVKLRTEQFETLTKNKQESTNEIENLNPKCNKIATESLKSNVVETVFMQPIPSNVVKLSKNLKGLIATSSTSEQDDSEEDPPANASRTTKTKKIPTQYDKIIVPESVSSIPLPKNSKNNDVANETESDDEVLVKAKPATSKNKTEGLTASRNTSVKSTKGKIYNNDTSIRSKRSKRLIEAEARRLEKLKASSQEIRRNCEEKSKRTERIREEENNKRLIATLEAQEKKNEKIKAIALEKENRKKEEEMKKEAAKLKKLEMEERRRREEAARLARLQEKEEERKRLEAVFKKKQEEEAEALRLKKLVKKNEEVAKNTNLNKIIQESKTNKVQCSDTVNDKNMTYTAGSNTTYTASNDPTSYDITPNRSARLVASSKTCDDYGIDEAATSDSSDDEEHPKKKVPLWATVENRKVDVAISSYVAFSVRKEIFKCNKNPSVEDIFGGKSQFKRARTSSAFWSTPPLLYK